jgi:hypothetical protein
MPHSEVDPAQLRQAVVADMDLYLAEYRPPEPGTTYGTPWTKERISNELEKMRECLVDVPYLMEYLCEDFDLSTGRPMSEPRTGFVVAEDADYRLLFDPQVGDFVLVTGGDDCGWSSFHVRGDAPTTFLAR